jgi:hypoxanthine-DNA glycosylase
MGVGQSPVGYLLLHRVLFGNELSKYSDNEAMKQGLEPLIWPESRVLILGTLPGDESLRVRQYYANPRNQFWKILEAFFAKPVPVDYQSRLLYLREHKLALWDLVLRAHRKSSRDRDIKGEDRNEFGFLADHRSLRAIALNGKRAQEMFAEMRGGTSYSHIRPFELPSTSGTPGRYDLPRDL